MNISVQPGTYVVAVSGGVDSMALLDMLRQQPGLKLVVAHFDHGIRPDSHLDRQLVQTVARQHGLPFVYHEGDLGKAASEDQARKARYGFLHAVKQASGARAIITAHHHDDVLETAILNMIRGTGRKGLSSLSSKATLHRPLLDIHKQQLKQYAKDQGLVWREDMTNQDTKYLRNHIRHNLLPQFSGEHKQQLVDIVKRAEAVNTELDTQLLHYLHMQPAVDTLDRAEFIRLPHAVAREVLATWLRQHGIRDFDQKALERIVINAKTLVPGKSIDVLKGHKILVKKTILKLASN